jgi:hypothetical protein
MRGPGDVKENLRKMFVMLRAEREQAKPPPEPARDAGEVARGDRRPASRPEEERAAMLAADDPTPTRADQLSIEAEFGVGAPPPPDPIVPRSSGRGAPPDDPSAPPSTSTQTPAPDEDEMMPEEARQTSKRPTTIWDSPTPMPGGLIEADAIVLDDLNAMFRRRAKARKAQADSTPTETPPDQPRDSSNEEDTERKTSPPTTTEPDQDEVTLEEARRAFARMRARRAQREREAQDASTPPVT